MADHVEYVAVKGNCSRLAKKAPRELPVEEGDKGLFVVFRERLRQSAEAHSAQDVAVVLDFPQECLLVGVHPFDGKFLGNGNGAGSRLRRSRLCRAASQDRDDRPDAEEPPWSSHGSASFEKAIRPPEKSQQGSRVLRLYQVIKRI